MKSFNDNNSKSTRKKAHNKYLLRFGFGLLNTMIGTCMFYIVWFKFVADHNQTGHLTGQGNLGMAIGIYFVLLAIIMQWMGAYVDILDEKVSCNYFSLNKRATDFDVDRGILGIYTVIGLLFLVLAIVAVIMKLKGSHETARTLSVIAVGLAIAMVAVTKAEVSSTYDYLAQGSGPFLCLVGTIVELTGTIMKN